MAEASISVDQNGFNCPVCLHFLKDPVTINCGHSLCMVFINGYRIQESTAVLNVERSPKKKASSAQHYVGSGDVKCDYCTRRKQKVLSEACAWYLLLTLFLNLICNIQTSKYHSLNRIMRKDLQSTWQNNRHLVSNWPKMCMSLVFNAWTQRLQNSLSCSRKNSKTWGDLESFQKQKSVSNIESAALVSAYTDKLIFYLLNSWIMEMLSDMSQ